MSDHRARFVLALVLAAASMILGSCETGTYQGGGDSEPYYR